MKAQWNSKLIKLNEDYRHVTGRRFAHFYCPILFSDEDVPLCSAHIVNRAFANSARRWTVQRKDVDAFFGSNFEADFAAIQYRERAATANALTDKTLRNLLHPKILLNNMPVDHYVAQGTIPSQHTRVVSGSDGKPVNLALKMSPGAVDASLGGKWELAVEKDVRLPALVSLIKSGHLTLFEMLGYLYALSAGGHFTGWEVLGNFFAQNSGKSKPEVLESATAYFAQFVHMVRPVDSSVLGLRGTITDRAVLICYEGDNLWWAFIVFVRTAQALHAVMLPILSPPAAAARFLRFLRDGSESVRARLARFEGDHWSINAQPMELAWPKSGVLYP